MKRYKAPHGIGPYAAVARTALADQMAWKGDVLFGTAMGAVRIALAVLLMTAVFNGRAEIGGMSLPLVTSYYLIAVFLFQIDQSSALADELVAEIRGGQLGKYLARPVDLLEWFLAVSAGRSVFRLTATVCAASLSALVVGPIFGLRLASVSALGVLAAVPLAVLGLLCRALANFMTATLAFKFQEVGSFNIAKNCVEELLSGSLLPLALFPSWARGALGWTPFPYFASAPADLVLGLGTEFYARDLAVLSGWTLALYLAARGVYAALSVRYEELGS